MERGEQVTTLPHEHRTPVELGQHLHPGADVLDPRRSEEHTSELQSLAYLVCRLLLEKKKNLDHGLRPQTLTAQHSGLEAHVIVHRTQGRNLWRRSPVDLSCDVHPPGGVLRSVASVEP